MRPDAEKFTAIGCHELQTGQELEIKYFNIELVVSDVADCRKGQVLVCEFWCVLSRCRRQGKYCFTRGATHCNGREHR